jgi:hypothetical protein
MAAKWIKRGFRRTFFSLKSVTYRHAGVSCQFLLVSVTERSISPVLGQASHGREKAENRGVFGVRYR